MVNESSKTVSVNIEWWGRTNKLSRKKACITQITEVISSNLMQNTFLGGSSSVEICRTNLYNHPSYSHLSSRGHPWLLSFGQTRGLSHRSKNRKSVSFSSPGKSCTERGKTLWLPQHCLRPTAVTDCSVFSLGCVNSNSMSALNKTPEPKLLAQDRDSWNVVHLTQRSLSVNVLQYDSTSILPHHFDIGTSCWGPTVGHDFVTSLEIPLVDGICRPP